MIVKSEELTSIKMSGKNGKKYSTIIHNGTIKTYVGIGWVTERKANKSDYNKYYKAVE
jgi:hypothetical protein